MGGSNLSREEVKRICTELECSPSKSSTPAPSGGSPSLKKGWGDKVAASGSTSTLDKAYRGKPGYKGRYARGARQE